MKGYFSQLARNSGLSLGPGGTTDAPGSPAHLAIPAPREGVAKVTPLHGQDVIHSTESPLPAPDGSENSKGVAGFPQVVAIAPTDPEGPTMDASLSTSMVTDDVNRQQSESSPAVPQTAPPETSIEMSPPTFLEESRVLFTDSESGAARPQAYFAGERSALDERMVQFPDEPPVVAQDSAPLEPVEKVETLENDFGRPEFSPNRQASRPEATGKESLQPTTAVERIDPAVLDEHLEQEVIVRNYLKEVRAWVAASPAMQEEKLEQDGGREGRLGSGDVFSLEHEINSAPFPQAGRSEAPAVQDLSLSIGTISIVIEEPQKGIPAPLVTQPVVERSARPNAQGNDREPTNLSRYYLRSW